MDARHHVLSICWMSTMPSGSPITVSVTLFLAMMALYITRPRTGRGSYKDAAVSRLIRHWFHGG